MFTIPPYCTVVGYFAVIIELAKDSPLTKIIWKTLKIMQLGSRTAGPQNVLLLNTVIKLCLVYCLLCLSLESFCAAVLTRTPLWKRFWLSVRMKIEVKLKNGFTGFHAYRVEEVVQKKKKKKLIPGWVFQRAWTSTHRLVSVCRFV